MMPRWLCTFLILAGLAAMTIPASATGPATARAEAGPWQPRQRALARVSARQQAVLSLPFAARILRLAVEPGARVAAGDLLAQFDAPRLRQHLAAWQQARREVALARKRLATLRQDLARHTVTHRDLLTGQQHLAQAEGSERMAWETLAADLDLLHVGATPDTLARRLRHQDLARVARDLGRLRAPFAGLVTRRQVALGEQVSQGTPLFELEALQQVYLDVGVPRSELADWSGGRARWQAAGRQGPLQPLDGAPLYDPGTGLWLLRYQAENPGLVLRDGAWVEVTHLGARRQVAWVPAAAVVSRNGKDWCLVRHGRGFEPVAVVVGPPQDGRIPILSGLSAGTEVVTRGAYELLYRDLKDLIEFVD